MNWSQIKEFLDCDGVPLDSNSELLSKGLLVFCNSNSIVQIYATNSLKKLDFTKDIDYNIQVFNNKFYFIKGKTLYSLSNDLKGFGAVYEAKEENLSLISENFCKDFTSKRNPRTFVNYIVDLKSKDFVYYWEDGKSLLFEMDNNFYFQTKFKGNLFKVDIKTNRLIWEIEIDNGIAGKRYYQAVSLNKYLFIRQLDGYYNLFNLNLENGNVIWEIEKTLYYYNYDDKLKKVFGLGGKTFEIINVETGERELQKELSENLHIASHLTYYRDGYLYFSGYRDNNIPVFGAVDVKTGELVFTQTVEMPGEKSFRKGLDRPVVVGNRLYVRDAMKTLHIYERIDTEA